MAWASWLWVSYMPQITSPICEDLPAFNFSTFFELTMVDFGVPDIGAKLAVSCAIWSIITFAISRID